MTRSARSGAASQLLAGLLVLPLALLVIPSAAMAQQPAGGQAAQEPDSTDLVFEREVFSYPPFERRNPFLALVGAGDGGPRFEELRLIGVIHSPNPALSVALLAVGGGGGGGIGETYRVRQGQVLGNSRILEIQQARVLVEVTEFGLTEQRELLIQRPEGGGSS